VYARGLDLKFENDAIIIVIANGKKLDYTEFQQMMGRSSRRLGQGKGYLIMFRDELQMCNTGVEVLQGRLKNKPREGSGNLLRFYQNVHRLTQK